MDTKVFSKRGEAAISTITAFIVSCLIYQGFSSMRDLKYTTSITPAHVKTAIIVNSVNK